MESTSNKEQVNIDSKSNKTPLKMLGRFLIAVAIINALEMVLKAASRYFLNGDTVAVSLYESYFGMIRFAAVVVAYIVCIARMRKVVSRNSIERKLLAIWGIILIPIQLINDLCSMLYTRLLEIVQAVLTLTEFDKDGSIYANIYDSSHGFKYVCILMAILLGIAITGEVLEKRKLLIFCLIVAALFMVAFTLFRMETFSIDTIGSVSIGLNWTSIIFHMLTTIGLFFIGFYVLKVNYSGDNKEEN